MRAPLPLKNYHLMVTQPLLEQARELVSKFSPAAKASPSWPTLAVRGLSYTQPPETNLMVQARHALRYLAQCSPLSNNKA